MMVLPLTWISCFVYCAMFVAENFLLTVQASSTADNGRFNDVDAAEMLNAPAPDRSKYYAFSIRGSTLILVNDSSALHVYVCVYLYFVQMQLNQGLLIRLRRPLLACLEGTM